MKTLTTTLEKSKELKLAGWSKLTHFTRFENLAGVESPALIETKKTESWKCYKKIQDGGVIRYYPAPTITELLEELDNNVITSFLNSTNYDLVIDFLRSPDNLADVCLWARKENLLGRDKER